MPSYPKAPAGASPENSHPPLPWPIAPDGTHVEVARWYHDYTEQRNAWEWVYTVSISSSEWDDGYVAVCFRSSRVRQDYVTKRLYSQEIVAGWGEVVCARSALSGRRAPPEIIRAFSEVVAQVRRAAEKHEAAYQPATDRQGIS